MRWWPVVSLLLVLTGCQGPVSQDSPVVSTTGWAAKSAGFKAGGEIADIYRGNGVSPQLSWTKPKTGTKSVALIMDDSDAPGFEPYVHWLVADLPPEGEIKQGGDGAGSVVGKNSHGDTKYFGPQPPSGTHHYHFALYALDATLGLQPGFSKQELLHAMKGHVLDQTELVALAAAR